MNDAKQSRILVVDDESAIRILLTDLLEEKGYQVLTPDLILLDICMPKMEGMAVCARLRQNPVTRHIPVIFLTAFNTNERLEQAIDMGGNDFLGKPINSVELHIRIKAMLQTRHIPDEVERFTEYLETMKSLRDDPRKP